MPSKPNYKLLSGLLTLIVLFSWFSFDSEAEPWVVKPGAGESARFQTLRSISQTFNQGYPFQIEPGIPMENHWEDPGPAFFLVCWGFVKKLLVMGPLDPLKDFYRMELAILVIPLLFLFFTKLFDLPAWYWFAVPLFFAVAALPFYTVSEFGYSKTNALLQLSVSGRWAKVPAAFWMLTTGLQLWNDFLKGKSFWPLKRLPYLVFVSIVLGILSSVRKDIQFTTFLSMVCLLISICRKEKFSPKSFLSAFLVITVLVGGFFAVRASIQTAWKVRDAHQEMKDVPRIYGHPTWHTLYAALDSVIPGKTIRWGDEDAWKDITSAHAGIRYGSIEHEKTAKQLYVTTILKYPSRYALHLLKNTARLLKSHLKLLVLLLFLGFWAFRKNSPPLSFSPVFIMNLIVSAVIPVFVVPDFIYSNDFRSQLYMAIICCALWIFMVYSPNAIPSD